MYYCEAYLKLWRTFNEDEVIEADKGSTGMKGRHHEVFAPKML